MAGNTNNGLLGAKNIGATIARRLHEIGVYSLADLQQLGPAEAYLKIKELYPAKTLSVCYYLFSFEGALLDVHWDDVPVDRKRQLLKAIGR